MLDMANTMSRNLKGTEFKRTINAGSARCWSGVEGSNG